MSENEAKDKVVKPATGVPKVKEFKPAPVEFKDGTKVMRTCFVDPLVVNGTCCVGTGQDRGTRRVYHVCPPDGPFNTSPNGWVSGEDLTKV